MWVESVGQKPKIEEMLIGLHEAETPEVTVCNQTI